MSKVTTATMAIVLALSGICRGSTPAWVGYGGPGGTRVYPDATPPTTFGTKDIAWRVEIPDGGWGHSQPVVIGSRVLLHVEYDEAFTRFPSLIAFNAADGSIAWKALLDHTPALANGEKIREAWIKLTDGELERIRLLGAYRKALFAKDEAGMAAANKAIVEAGYQEATEKTARSGYPKLRAKEPNRDRDLWNLAKRGGFAFETWREGLKDCGGTTWCLGHAYATPVSDLPAESSTQAGQAGGKHVWVQTAFGGFFCFDLNGELVWCKSSVGQLGEYCRNGRSPILWADPASGKLLLLSDITNKVRAFDAATGELLWSDEGPMAGKEGVHTIITPVVARIGGTSVLWAAGCNPYRLPDGKRLALEGWNPQDYGTQVIVNPDRPDVIYLCGSGEHSGWTQKGFVKTGPNPPAALKLSLDGETLRVEVLWHGGSVATDNKLGSKEVISNGAASMVIHDGKFYHAGGAIFDALTGKLVTGVPGKKAGAERAVPQTRHMLCIAGGHVYGLQKHYTRQKGAKPAMEMQVYTTDGTLVANNVIPGSSYGYPVHHRRGRDLPSYHTRTDKNPEIGGSGDANVIHENNHVVWSAVGHDHFSPCHHPLRLGHDHVYPDGREPERAWAGPLAALPGIARMRQPDQLPRVGRATGPPPRRGATWPDGVRAGWETLDPRGGAQGWPDGQHHG